MCDRENKQNTAQQVEMTPPDVLLLLLLFSQEVTVELCAPKHKQDGREIKKKGTEGKEICADMKL